MGMSKRGKRALEVDGQSFVWWRRAHKVHVADSARDFYIRYAADSDASGTVTVVGSRFRNVEGCGGAERTFVCPAFIDFSRCTPAQVAELVRWATAEAPDPVEIEPDDTAASFSGSNSEDPQIRYQVFMRGKSHSKARRLCLSALSKDPGTRDANYFLALVAGKQGNREQAAKHHQLAWQLHRNQDALFRACDALIGLGHLREATGLLSQASKAPELVPDVLLRRARMEHRTGQPDRARQLLQEALALRPDDATLLRALQRITRTATGPRGDQPG